LPVGPADSPGGDAMRDAFWEFLANPERVLRVVAWAFTLGIVITLAVILGWAVLWILVPFTFGFVGLWYITCRVPPYYLVTWGRLFKYIFRRER